MIKNQCLIHLFLSQSLFSSIINDSYFQPKIVIDDSIYLKVAPLQYHFTQYEKIEPSKITDVYKIKKPGKYQCVVCDVELFKSEQKYKTRTGYPSFHTKGDNVHVMPETTTEYDEKINQQKRSWLKCVNCGSNIGVVYFDDVKSETGLRYSANSLSIRFRSQKNEDYGFT